MAEKTKEQLQAEAEKAAETMYAIVKKRNEVEKELANNPKDEKLKKKLEGLEKAVQKAKDKHSEAMEAVTAAQATLKETQNSDGDGKKIRLKVRNKTGRPTYYRAGLCFGPTDAEYEVTEDVAQILVNDPWLDGKTIK